MFILELRIIGLDLFIRLVIGQHDHGKWYQNAEDGKDDEVVELIVVAAERESIKAVGKSISGLKAESGCQENGR